ncbi:MAG TPA: ROK family protein [Humisphaera sp.]|jgi:glucokinase|nr:ROK family protein [Humisphaera sp.]
MFIGVEIGGTKLQVVAGDGRRGIVRRWRGSVEPRYGAAGIREKIKAAVTEMKKKEPGTQAIGVGFGGPVDFRAGTICKSHHISGWDDFPLAQWLAEVAAVRAVVDNDANVAAFGEAVRGAGVGCDPVFYVTMGSGVGGGLVCNGAIYHGAPPGESELGHVRLDRSGATVESRCSGWAVDARIRRLQSEQPDSTLARLIGNSTGGEARFLPKALAQNDQAAWAVLRELADDLAFGLSHAVHLFHPQMIVLGGGLSLMGEPLATAVANALPPYVMGAFHPVPIIKLAALGEDAVPIGALELAARLVSNVGVK